MRLYAPLCTVLGATDQLIRNANWRARDHAPVLGGWYDLSSGTHFLGAGDLETDIFGSRKRVGWAASLHHRVTEAAEILCL